MKQDLYEGGIRVPTVAWWPDTIPAGIESDHPAQFADFMATLVSWRGSRLQATLSRLISFPLFSARAPIRRSPSSSTGSFTSATSKQAVRFGKWKAIRQPMFTGSIELYDLDADIGESKNLAGQFPKIVETAKTYMEKVTNPTPTGSAVSLEVTFQSYSCEYVLIVL